MSLLQKVGAVILFFAMFLMLGTAGALDLDAITFTLATRRVVVAVIMCIVGMLLINE